MSVLPDKTIGYPQLVVLVHFVIVLNCIGSCIGFVLPLCLNCVMAIYQPGNKEVNKKAYHDC